jgi:hypothetical protein
LSVGADEDNDPKVGDNMADWPEATSATRLGCRTSATTVKQSRSKATTTTEAAKTAKLEAAKKKRKRKTDPAPTSQNVEEEDEATDELLVMDELSVTDDHASPKSPSPATKR